MNAAPTSASTSAAPGVNDELLAAMIAGHYADTVGSDDDDDDDDYTVKGDQAAWGTPLFKIFMSQAGITKKVSAAPAPPPRTPARTLTGAPRPNPPPGPSPDADRPGPGTPNPTSRARPDFSRGAW